MTDYTYQPGAIAASGKLRKATVSEVTNELLVHAAWEGVLAYDLGLPAHKKKQKRKRKNHGDDR